jgi:hypothetical protein
VKRCIQCGQLAQMRVDTCPKCGAGFGVNAPLATPREPLGANEDALAHARYQQMGQARKLNQEIRAYKALKATLLETTEMKLAVDPEKALSYVSTELLPKMGELKFSMAEQTPNSVTYLRRYWPWWVIALCFLPPIGFLLMLRGRNEDRIVFRVYTAAKGSTLKVASDVRGPRGVLAGFLGPDLLPDDYYADRPTSQNRA